SDTVMPTTPMPVSASFTSSSLNGLMIASIFFIWASEPGVAKQRACRWRPLLKALLFSSLRSVAGIERDEGVRTNWAVGTWCLSRCQLRSAPGGVEFDEPRAAVRRLHDLEPVAELEPVERSPGGIVVDHEEPPALGVVTEHRTEARSKNAAAGARPPDQIVTARSRRSARRADDGLSTGRTPSGPALGDVVLAHLRVERRPAEAEQRGRGLLVPARRLQGPKDRRAL